MGRKTPSPGLRWLGLPPGSAGLSRIIQARCGERRHTMASSLGQLPVTADNVQEAIRLMYGQSNPDPAATQAASRWLSAAKASPQAWDFLWVLLMPDKSEPEQFLGATFLRDKIREHWGELPQERAAALQSRVLEATVSAQTKQGSASRTLTEALAALAVQMTPDQWPDVIPDLTRTCQSLGDARLGAKLLLSVLTEMPNEINKCLIRPAKRQAVKECLRKHIPQVLELVLSLLKQGPDEQVASRCMELLGAWVDLDLLVTDLLPVLDLVLVPFVGSPALISVTLDMMDRVVSSPANYNYPSSVLQLAVRVLTLTPFIKQFVDEKEPESLVALGNVFTSLVSSHSRTFVSALTGSDESQADIARRTIGAVLDLASVPGRYPTDETVSELTFGVWYTLQDDILASDEHKEQLTEQLQPVYSALLNVMVQKSMLPKDPSEYSPDEAEAFRRYRQDILDFYTYTQSLLGDYILNSFIIYLHGAMQAVREDPSNWPALESVLHGLTGLGESCDDDLVLVDSMRTVLLTLPEIPYSNNKKLMAAALKLIDSNSACLDLHPDCLFKLIPMLLAGLTDPDVALYSTMALKDICQEAPASMAPHAAQVLTACKEVLQADRLSGRECVRLMYVVGSLLRFVTEHEERLKVMDDIIRPFIQEFKRLVDGKDSKVISSKSLLVVRVNMFASLASAMAFDDEQSAGGQLASPLLLLLRELLPSLLFLANCGSEDEVMAECICHFLQRSMSSLDDAMEPFVDASLNILSTLYSKEPHPQVLDLVRQMLLTFRLEGPLGPVMQQVFGQVCAGSVRYFSADLGRYPESLVKFWEVLSQLVKKRPNYLTGVPTQLGDLLLLASACVTLPDRRVMCSSCSFLAHLISKAPEHQVFASHLGTIGAQLVHQLLTAIGGAVPRDCVDHTADVFLAMNRANAGDLSRWLTAVLAQDDFPTRRVNDADKKIFMKHVLHNRSNMTFLRGKVAIFSQQCRGLYGSEYAAATLNTGDPPSV
ncbi:importin-13-like isoform X2 [Amphibalanus amphitrite]|uniref:importin-13-like isoform X2 n=2 Tax=Amphibalanus amphitrite TaxID=1232801 RepID=UPI001C92B62A|nr:importin-13-like isoform X2 [Amphibalanus amphitrite]